MRQTALAALAAAAIALPLAAGPAAAGPLPEEWLGELADARALVETLEENGTPAEALVPARAALECWADAAASQAARCRDIFFARVADSAAHPILPLPDAARVAAADPMAVDLWFR